MNKNNVKAVLKSIAVGFRNIFSSKSVAATFSYAEKKETAELIAATNAKRAFALSAIVVLQQLFCVISDSLSNFYAESPVTILNLVAECILLPSSVLTLIIVSVCVQKNQYKITPWLLKIYFFVAALAMSLFIYSDIIRGKYASSAVFYIAVMFSIGSIFEFRVSLLYAAMYTSVATAAYIVKDPFLLLDNFQYVLVLAASLLLSSYFRCNFFKVQASEFKMRTLNCRLKDLSEIDSLMQLPNRRKLYAFLDEHMDDWQLEQRKIGVAICDIDYFKNYNDTFSHVKGDECLRVLGELFARYVAENGCFVARVGGEELCLVFWQENNGVAIGEKLDKLLARVRALNMPSGVGAKLDHLTISVGACLNNVSAEYSFDSAYELADKQLYIAKENGKDCYSLLDCTKN